MRKYDPDFLDRSAPFDTYDLPSDGTPDHHTDLFTAHGVRFSKGRHKTIAEIPTRHPAQNALIVLLAESGSRGLVRVPIEKIECERLTGLYENFLKKRGKRMLDLIGERIADEEMQESIYGALKGLMEHH